MAGVRTFGTDILLIDAIQLLFGQEEEGKQ